MSYLSQQTTQLKQAQVTETLLRMKKLKIHDPVIQDFHKSGKLYKSEIGILYWLDEEEERMVREWERETGNIVYHVIPNNFEYGFCYSLLYVSPYPEEWKADDIDLENGLPIVHVINKDRPDFSEYGTIGVQPAYGGVIRTI